MRADTIRTPDLPWLGRAALFGSGCGALAGLVGWGSGRDGWRRVWLPSYNCPEVPAALAAAATGVQLLAYPDAALEAPAALDAIPVEQGDIVVVVNQLGIRPRPDVAAIRRRGAVVVEDHSHDPASPWALASDADYAFASLRKTLPIPDGGAVWSPRGLALPPEPVDATSRDGTDPTRLAAVLEGRAGAAREGDQLRFRTLARVAAGSDEPVPGAPISPVSQALLGQMPVGAWRDRRRRNLAILAEAVEGIGGSRVLRAPADGVAFALTLLFDGADARAAARHALTARAVVPVVLWPLDTEQDWGAGPADADLSRRILSIHGDQRFDADDMRRLAAILREALGS